MARKRPKHGGQLIAAQHYDPAVRASRRAAPDGLDDFPTPPWATRALCEVVLAGHLGQLLSGLTVAEPCANRMIMADVLAEYAGTVRASDVFDYGFGADVRDFLDTMFAAPFLACDWFITNPPFSVALDMALLALERARTGVALLLRTQWMEGEERYRRLFSTMPPTLIAPFVERVPMVEGRWDPDADTATAYAWFVWMRNRAPQPIFWIPPGRRVALTRADDRRRFASRGQVSAEFPLLDAPAG